jgi:hypothetical protein
LELEFFLQEFFKNCTKLPFPIIIICRILKIKRSCSQTILTSSDPYFVIFYSNCSFYTFYNQVPTEWSNAADDTACEHIGYMIDGAKLYGFCGVESCYVQNSSSTPTHEDDYTYTSGSDCYLDECNMMEIDGEMAYVMTPNYPYVPPCLKGDLATIYGFTPE